MDQSDARSKRQMQPRLSENVCGDRRLSVARRCDLRCGVVFLPLGYRGRMSDASDNLMPADPRDLADALAFALRFQGRKRIHNADEIMAEIVAKRLVEHLERAGFVVMKRAPIAGGGALGRGFEG